MQQQKVAWEVQPEVQSEVCVPVCFSRVAENGEVTDMYAVAVLRAPSVPGTLGCDGSLRAAAKKGTNEASHQSTDNGPLSR